MRTLRIERRLHHCPLQRRSVRSMGFISSTLRNPPLSSTITTSLTAPRMLGSILTPLPRTEMQLVLKFIIHVLASFLGASRWGRESTLVDSPVSEFKRRRSDNAVVRQLLGFQTRWTSNVLSSARAPMKTPTPASPPPRVAAEPVATCLIEIRRRQWFGSSHAAEPLQ